MISVADVAESETQQPENPASAAVDGNMATRWSCQGDQWLQLDLGTVKKTNYVAIAFYMGTVRESYFDIEVSNDEKTWTTVYTGHSSGISDDMEVFNIGDTECRYVRIHGKGNSTNGWNSYTEVQVYGK